MKIRIGDYIESDYGRGMVVAITHQWIIHNNSLNNDEHNEFALLQDGDFFVRLDAELVKD